MHESDSLELPPGTHVSGTVVEARVKAGGFGTVYRARDPLTGTLFALKFISLRQAEARARRECAIAMPWHHANLGRQLGFGFWPLTLPRFLWLKSLYIEGPELGVWAHRDNPDARDVVLKGMGVTRALAVVHSHGVVHRDVKEANILVRDRDGEPVLVDFGAARREGQNTLTEGVLPPGTADYRAPEAWRFFLEKALQPGAHYRPGPADDLYALGVVLYRLLTNRSPFEVEVDEPESLQAVLHQVPLPPHILNPRVPEPLSGVCLKLLEKRPEDRYPSALALYEALDGLLAGADDSWRVPLRDKASASEETRRPRWLSMLPRAGVAMAVGVGLLYGGWRLATWDEPSPTQGWRSGQEVASPGAPPEIERASAPPQVANTPAAVAPTVTQSKDDAVTKPQAPGAPGNTKKKILAPAARWCLGAAAAAQAACTGTPVRPTPADVSKSTPSLPECPEGGFESMKALELSPLIDGLHLIGFTPLGEPPDRVFVREGATTVELRDPWGKLERRSTFQGQLVFGQNRVYGRFTEARTPNGATFKICVELTFGGDLGAKSKETKDTANIFSVQDVVSVYRERY